MIRLIIILIIILLIYVNYYFILCLLKNILGKDFPVKEHDNKNDFSKNGTNIFDDIYYNYSTTQLNKLNHL